MPFDGCGGGKGGSARDCSFCCDFISIDWPNFSRKTWKRILVVIFLLATVASYWFYGRAVTAIDVVDTGASKSNLVSRFTKRTQPNIKVLLIVSGRKYYSDALQLTKPNVEYRLTISDGPVSFTIDSLQILDSRINLLSNKLDISQILEEFEDAQEQGNGERFKYKLVRRWHFFH
jgi:hypothetical protein